MMPEENKETSVKNLPETANDPAPASLKTQKDEATGSKLNNLMTLLVDIGALGGYVFRRFRHDQMQQRASALTFTSLLALVPLLAVSFAIFAAFPAFDRLKGDVQSFLFENFVPQVGTEVQGYLESFTQKTGGLTAVGVIFLAVTAIMLLMNISGAMNTIWRVKNPRAVVSRLAIFWTVLTIAPLFFGASLSLSSYLFTLAQTSGVENYVGSLTWLIVMAPFALEVAGFTILYAIIPNYPVQKRDAVIGGLLAGTLFESLKKGFGLYVTSFPTYETIYGAMATVPIFLLWVYLSWIVVLFCAELTASLPEWRAGNRDVDSRLHKPIKRLGAALSILHQLRIASETGEGITDKDMARKTRLGPNMLSSTMEMLEQGSYLSRAEDGRFHLVRNLENQTLDSLAEELELTLPPQLDRGHLRDAWAHRLQDRLGKVQDQSREFLHVPLSILLADPGKDEDLPEDLPEIPHPASDAAQPGALSRLLALMGLGLIISGR